MSINLTEIAEYYVNLLILQYKGKPKAEAIIRNRIMYFLEKGILWDVRDAFNINTATGYELDIIGKYVGIDRYYSRQTFPNTIFFSFASGAVEYTQAAGGFYSVVSNNGGARLFSINDVAGNSNSLFDETYRFIMKLKIIQNNSNFSLASIDNDLKRFYGEDIYVDTTNDMDIIYNVKKKYALDFNIAVQKGAVPIPAGRTLTINIFT